MLGLMSPIIHGCVGWLIGQPLTKRRDRVVVTVAALAPDLDGLGLLISEDLYVAWHHRLAHGAAFAVATFVVAALAASAHDDGDTGKKRLPHRLTVGLLALVAFHSHVAMDLVGSGPGWPILYFYPWSTTEWLPSWQWDLASWQNSVFGLATLLLCLGQALPRGRTPVELFSLRADAAVVTTLRRRFLGPTTSGRP
jgi:hypothetical protein